MPSKKDLHIAPLRTTGRVYDIPHRDHSSANVLPPLRDSHARYDPTTRPAPIEPSPQSQSNTSSSAPFHQPRRRDQSPRQQPPSSSSSKKPRSGTSRTATSSRSSGAALEAPQSRHSSSGHARHERSQDDGKRRQESYPKNESYTSSQPAGSPYNADAAAYPTPVRSSAGYSDVSSEPRASPSSVAQSPTVLVSRPAARWSLRVRQQPRAARACGFGERDRRVIDPPPIVQMEGRDYRGRTLDRSELGGRSSVMSVSLWDETGTRDCTLFEQPGRKAGGTLMGTLHANPSFVKDETGEDGIFFAFPDISCRSCGMFRLQFALIIVEPRTDQPGVSAPVVAYAMSNVFTVYSAKDFPGMRPSTALTQALKSQGIAIPVKKGKQSSSRGTVDDEDDDDD